MTRLLIAVTAVSLTASSLTFAAKKPRTEEDKTFYALGLAIAEQLARYDLSKPELEMVKAGLDDGVTGTEPVVTLSDYGPKLAEVARTRAEAASQKEKTASAEFLAQVATEAGAEKSDSGLVYFELVAGDGPQPAATDTVEVHYTGTLRDGTVFDSSVARGQPAKFGLNRVIACWTEGVQKMKVGGKSKLVCPAEIAYGDRGAPPQIRPGAALVFEVELLGIE